MAADTVVCTIGVSAQEALERDWRIDLHPNGHDTATVVLRQIRPTIHATIMLSVNGDDVFWGYITKIAEFGGKGTAYYSRVTAISKELLCDRIYVTETYAAGMTMHDMVEDLRATYLNSRGITHDTSMPTGPTLPAMTFTRRALTDVLTEIAAVPDATSGNPFTWRITPADVLEWREVGSASAPFNISNASLEMLGDVQVEQDETSYANSVVVVGGTDQVRDDLNDAWHGDGSTRAFVLHYTGITGYRTCSVNGTPAPVGVYGVDDMAWTYQASANTLHQKVTETVLTASDTLTFSVTAQLPVLITVQNAAEIASRGQWDAEPVAYPDQWDIFGLQTYGQARLDQVEARPVRVSYTCQSAAFRPGMAQLVALTPRNLTSTACTVQSVSMTMDQARVKSAVDATSVSAMFATTSIGGVFGKPGVNRAPTVISGSGGTAVEYLQTALDAIGLSIDDDGIVVPREATTTISEPNGYQFSGYTGLSGLFATSYGLYLSVVEDAGCTVYLSATAGNEFARSVLDTNASGSPFWRVLLSTGGASRQIEYLYDSGLKWGGGAYIASSDDVWAGAWVSPAFDAGDYTASGSMTWTVASGDVETYKYCLNRSTLFLIVNLVTTTVGGTPSTALQITLPAGLAGVGKTSTVARIVDNGTQTFGVATVDDTGTVVKITKGDSANWTASTNATNIRFEMFLEVT